MSAVLVLLLLLLLLREGTSGRPQRAKRRVPPRLDKPLSLEELKFEVCGLRFVYTGRTLLKNIPAKHLKIDPRRRYDNDIHAVAYVISSKPFTTEKAE